ncbi:hypothetical protein NCAS_0G02330 [Naumovozyma castellii]|uniref:Integrase catalytic domain-containing protein n=1 Tax=Naumovozyma castellii TaxID=27288 RepID=G0VI85_NAUCA|nr:hypothetical protein NCAS_0G02330 [Naumovozyma castellii CBS 4309]CCC71120.1 hypothetical protein NCAS_0G02330 [Naumovozyma castellii CBS 4309]
MVCQPETINGRTFLYPIAFYSIQFSQTQQNYSTVERELFAVLHTLEKARLILSPQITIFTDNTGIVSIGRSARNTHPRFTKYLDILNGYRLTWKHIPGPKNVVADYLSRFGLDDQPYLHLADIDKTATEIELNTIDLKAVNTDYNDITNATATTSTDNTATSTDNNTTSTDNTTISTDNATTTITTENTTTNTPINDELTDEFIIETPNNLNWTEILSIKQILSDSATIPRKFTKVIKSFAIINDTLYYFLDGNLYNIINDAEYMDRATELHKLFHASHRVLKQMMLTDKIWSPNGELLTLDVTRTCRHCEVHQRFVDLPVTLPSIIKVPVFSRWHLDFAGPLPKDNIYRHFLIAVDYTSNFVVVQPARAADADTVKDMILHILSMFGKPDTIVTDNAKSFENQVVRPLTTKLGIKYLHSSVYHPRGNSKAERSVQMVKKVLSHIHPNYKDWSSNIYWAGNIVNSTRLMYGYAPAEIAFGIPPKIDQENFSNLLKDFNNDTMSRKPQGYTEQEEVHLAMHNIERTKIARQKTMDARERIREMLKLTRKGKERDVQFEKGELVYKWRQKTKKSEPTWDGPYRICGVVGKHTYLLRGLNGETNDKTFHGSKLKPAYSHEGSAIRTAAEFTRVYSDKERDYFINTFEDVITDLNRQAARS